MTIVRAMTPADFGAAAAISGEAAQRALVGRPYWETESDVAGTVKSLPAAEFIVAEDPDKGVVGLAGYDLNPGGEAPLFGPLVTVEGHGIGAFLSARIEAMARQRGATGYSMLIGLTNKSGSAWAEWRGYQLDSEEPETLYAWLYPEAVNRAAGDGSGMVRRAGPGDLDPLYELYQLCFSPGLISPERWAGWLSECWVLERQGRIEGLLHLNEANAFLHHLCIHPGARRQGLSSYLVAQAAAQFWKRNPTRIGISVRLDNTAAVSALRRLGFRREIAVAKWVKREG